MNKKPGQPKNKGTFFKKNDNSKNRVERSYKTKSGAGKEITDKTPPYKGSRFPRFENEDLSFGKGKQKILSDQKPKKDEITFSKSIEKWETQPAHPRPGSTGKRTAINKTRHEKDKFKKRFDPERKEDRKVYSASGNLHREYRMNKVENEVLDAAITEPMPLNKFIAHCGVCSRRDAVPLIKAGKVKVNGELILEPGHKVTSEDMITLSGKKLFIQKNLVYILLNKPKGYITTTDDPSGRRTVLDIFEHQIEQRIFPVGRLDRNTTGLLLLTNDGSLAQQLAHPKYEIRKIYQVSLNKNLSVEDFQKIKAGVILEDGPAPVDQVAYLESKNQIGVEIHSGKNRIIRRIFESLNYEVKSLDRVMYAGLTKKNVPRGKWRFLSRQEVINLKHLNNKQQVKAKP